MRDGAMASRKVDVNTATLEQLESLLGVGRAKAQTILDSRRVCTSSSNLQVPGMVPNAAEHGPLL